ncbi:hypothetical protein EDD92_0065 [Streptomyces sp. TLI_185]|nr:hypothetical protein EDD92_0065 [Streptomyces sp. TLI_185]
MDCGDRQLEAGKASFKSCHLRDQKLKKIQYSPHLIDGCLPPASLTMDDDAI